MTNCPQCGAVEQNGRFCVQCGAALPAPAPYDAPTVTEPAGSDTVLRRGPAWPAAESPQFGGVGGRPPSARPPNAPQRSDRVAGWWIVAAAAVVVVAISVTAVVLLNRGTEGGSAGIVATATALPPASPTASGGPITSGGTEAQRSADAASGSATAATVSGATVPAAPGPGSVASVLGTTAPAPTVATGLAATQQAAIPCGNAYIVQVASELDQPAFAARVSAVQSANQLTPGAKWTQTSDSCAIFTSQINALVLYSGPYGSPYDACPARLASPPDAFIKGTTPATSSTYVSCLCPAETSSLPAIHTVGEQGVWIGELQRVLGSRLDFSVGSINADPSVGDPGRWGTYTAETAAAVGRFQADAGLPVTSQVDGATWAALRGQSC
jgi:hypothetical protein